ncbi:MAG: acyltransferase domain-containing protein [Eubacteriales bacterium]|nr:acyltransferase domain-containing protein [Eubacteriales bacterium]
MEKYGEYIREICGTLQFPEEAQQFLSEAWEKLQEEKEAAKLLNRWIARYDKDEPVDYEAALEDAAQAAGRTGVHRYTAQLLLFLCMTRHLRELYEKRGISPEIWRASCLDLKWKLLECRKMYGIWGSFVAFWFPGFFELTRFALGRLQFELVDFPENYEKAGRKRPAGMTKAINVHIPSCGRLNREECHASYRQAAAFFADAFPTGQAAVTCSSWLLYPPHRQFLKPDSGVVRFMDEYDIYRTWENDGDLWRVFDLDYDGRPETLPETTAMQRGYKEWLTAGNHAGGGEGIFFLPVG